MHVSFVKEYIYVHTEGGDSFCIYVRVRVCMYVYLCVCKYARMYACMYVCSHYKLFLILEKALLA